MLRECLLPGTPIFRQVRVTPLALELVLCLSGVILSLCKFTFFFHLVEAKCHGILKSVLLSFAAAEHLLAQHSAIKMLYNRVKTILEYVKAVKAGLIFLIYLPSLNWCDQLPDVFQSHFLTNEGLHNTL